MTRLILALCFWAGTLWGQSPFRVDPGNAPSTDRAHFQAETSCDGSRVDTQNLRDLTAEQAAENAVHEAVHRAQLTDDCAGTMALWDRDITARVGAEAEASCEGWKAGSVPARLWSARGVRAAAWWARYTTIGYEAALGLYDRACGVQRAPEEPYHGRTYFYGGSP